MHVASSVNTSDQVKSTVADSTESAQVHGVATISVNGVSLEATFRLEPEGLSVIIRGFDGADPDGGTRMSDKLLLKPGERRVIRIRRAYSGSPAHFTITRIGDGIQISSEES